LPGTLVQFSVNAAGEVVLHRPRPAKGASRSAVDCFEAVRGRADVPWPTDELMTLLRPTTGAAGGHVRPGGLLTRDASRFRTGFPTLEVLAP